MDSPVHPHTVDALLPAGPGDPIRSAIEHYRKVTAYQALITSASSGKPEILRYYFRKPGYVRMEFIQPFKNVVLVFDPTRKQVRLWPFGYRNFPEFTLSPENALVQSRTGQRVDRSDVGFLFRTVQALQEHGKTEVVGIESVDGKEAVHVAVQGEPGFSVEKVRVHRFQLWLDQTTCFPLRVSSNDAAGRLIEAVEMRELRLNPSFPDDFFKL